MLMAARCSLIDLLPSTTKHRIACYCTRLSITNFWNWVYQSHLAWSANTWTAVYSKSSRFAYWMPNLHVQSAHTIYCCSVLISSLQIWFAETVTTWLWMVVVWLLFPVIELQCQPTLKYNCGILLWLIHSAIVHFLMISMKSNSAMSLNNHMQSWLFVWVQLLMTVSFVLSVDICWLKLEILWQGGRTSN